MPKRLQYYDPLNHAGRRRFIRNLGLGAVGLQFGKAWNFSDKTVAIVINPANDLAKSGPAQWAMEELTASLASRNITVQKFTKIEEVDSVDLCLYIVSGNSQGVSIPAVPEGLGFFPGKSKAKKTTIVGGHDVRGLVYALLELNDRVIYSNQPLEALYFSQPLVEQPANRVRSLNRLFVSEIEDKAWYNDREMWPAYLTMLATQRFNRFNLSFGIGYDFLQNVTDAYFLFAYPFLLSVPGYDVHVPELPENERESNLAMLKFISEQTVARGMDFQLGIWMHGYEWLNTTHANYTIKGLNAENHANYCRDALRMLLQACPAISGITFRIHGESGVNEGSYNFWKTIFDGIKTCGRKVEIDMHSKGIDDQMIETALSVGVPVTVSPKWWAEHLGLPYHQADIRAQEVPKENAQVSKLMSLSAGSRSFTRYGYADLFKEDRKYDIVHRIWPGTQRLLMWGDPESAASQSRCFSFCGGAGVELMEPLSFKGRRGSGVAGNRCGYEDSSLFTRWDWQKYLYTLRVFGRSMYNPATSQVVWDRYLQSDFNTAFYEVRESLANATRILPLVLTAHGVSAGNNTYWPEMYTNMPVTDLQIRHPYTDTPSPRVFGMVSPMDPQLFSGINEYALKWLEGEKTGKYSPVEVATWLDEYAANAEKLLSQAVKKINNTNKPAFRRMEIDVKMQVGLGRFFADKIRAGLLFALYKKTSDKGALEKALQQYKKARNQWASLANSVAGIYKSDVTAGESAHLRGHWLDRLPAIDLDIAEMQRLLNEAKAPEVQSRNIRQAVDHFTLPVTRPLINALHSPPKNFARGQEIKITIDVKDSSDSVKLYYRHVNHAERYNAIEMKKENEGRHFTGMIPASYTNTAYPLAYYFEISDRFKNVGLFPGLGVKHKGQPYFVIRQS